MFNMKEWCPLHRSATTALRAELADLRSFVRQNVLDADAAARVGAKIEKACAKFDAVEASSESLILAFEADCGGGPASRPMTDAEMCASGEGSGSGSGSDTREQQVISHSDVGELPSGIATSATAPATEAEAKTETKAEEKAHEKAHDKAHSKKGHAHS